MNILITGASSGIGEHLAYEYAKQGHKLYLTGRHLERLNKVAKKVKALGGEAETFISNVCDKQQMEDIVHSIKHLDIVIANAGISNGTLSKNGISHERTREILDTNIWGVVNTIYPAIEKMKKQKSGQIVIVSSMAGFKGLGGSSHAYCASKACVRVLGESLHLDLINYGIKVNVVCPGWIKSSLTDKNDYTMPLLMETDKACKIIISQLEKNKTIIKFPLRIYWVVRILEFLPMKAASWILGKLNN
jgi:short-subunit dehydrogenase